MHTDHPHWAFLSTEAATAREIRFAKLALAVSALIFLAAFAFVKTPLPRFPAFVPMYVSALIICDLITAALLFGQYGVLGARGLLVLAGAYLFSACSTLAYALVFPGLSPLPGGGGAGPQTSSAMYMFWHSGFPLFIIAYARTGPTAQPGRASALGRRSAAPFAVLAMVAAVVVAVIGFTLLATLGHDAIPVFLEGDKTSPLGHAVLFVVWLLSLTALLALMRRGARTVLDVWLMIVMCAWLFDIALAALINTGRYDLGWYCGRVYGMLAASFLLIVLLLENSRQYTRMVEMAIELSTANATLAQLTRHDSLTELANRRYFDEYLAEQIALAQRSKRPLTLVLCDIDHFKAFNDHYGHPGGDACLRQVALSLRACCRRPADMAARYGGEEFAFILPDTDLIGAAQVADAARAALAFVKIPHVKSAVGPHVTISAGVAALNASAGMTAAELIEAADQALYRAKAMGRNQVLYLNSHANVA